jgi:hypothetical protein
VGAERDPKLQITTKKGTFERQPGREVKRESVRGGKENVGKLKLKYRTMPSEEEDSVSTNSEQQQG